MKKILFLIPVCCALTAVAQVRSIAFLGGLSSTNISGTAPFDGQESRTGFTSGFGLGWKIKKKITLGADILCSQMGFKFRAMLTDVIGGPEPQWPLTSFYYDYLMIPLKTGYTFGNRFKILPEIGIYPSLLLSARHIFPVLDMYGRITGDSTLNVTGNVPKFDLGGFIGAGAGYTLGTRYELFSSVIFRYGITTFSGRNYFRGSNMRHYGLSLYLGIKYNI